MKYLSIAITLLFINISFSQANLKISLTPYNAGVPFEFNTNVPNLSGENYSLSILYYYISSIHIIHDGGQDLDLSDTVIIIKNESNTIDLGFQNISNVEEVNFGIGVPQNLNHLDISLYPIDHPLSYQIPSMQWGWASGYNQVGIVGKDDVNNDGTPEVAFELFPIEDALYKNVSLPVSSTLSQGSININIHVNIDQWMKSIDLGTNGILHESNGNNVTLMDNVLLNPVFTLESNALTPTLKAEEGKIFYMQSTNSLDVYWSEFLNASKYSLLNISGQILFEGDITNNKDMVQLRNLSTGSYWFIISSKDGNQLNKLRIIK